MSRVPWVTLDLTDDVHRRAFALWLQESIEMFVLHVRDDFAKAAARGVEQASVLINDPSYYETVKMRRVRARKRDKEMQEQSRIEWQERRDEEDRVMREGIVSGRIKLFPKL